VGCERFFGKSGYISQPWRSRLGVRNYERIALLSTILNCVYIDPDEVAKEYLARCKKGAWKKKNTIECLKCFNLERVIAAGDSGMGSPKSISLDEYIRNSEAEDRIADVIDVDDE
jgi:hypothetical protein